MKQKYVFTVLIEPAEEGGFTVTCPVLPGLIAEGDTLKEAREQVKDAISIWVDSLNTDGLPIPQDKKKKIRVERISATVLR